MNPKNYAIAEIASDQVILAPGAKVAVPKLDLEVGSKYIADKILFMHLGEEIKVGTPYLTDTSIETTVLEHKRLPKVTVFKKKRRKGFKVKKGHRQPYTILQVAQFGLATPVPSEAQPPQAAVNPSNPAQEA
jgi:large subunit ribosomal protein L21